MTNSEDNSDNRSIRSQIFFKIGAVKIFCKFNSNTPVMESLFKNIRTYNFIKKRFQHNCFSVKFAKFLRTSFYRTPSVAASKINTLAVLLKAITSSHQRCSIIKCLLRNFSKFTKKHLCQGLFLNEHPWTTASERCPFEKKFNTWRSVILSTLFDQ